MEFLDKFYGSIDLQRAVRDQFGSAATLTSVGDHLYDWRAKIGGEQKNIDLKRAVAKQYGSSYIPVAVGVHKYDWKAFRFDEPDYVVLPVMLIAQDKLFDIAGVRSGLTRYRSILGRVQDWYNERVGGDLRLLKPLIIPTTRISCDWNMLTNMTDCVTYRYAFHDAAKKAYDEGKLPRPGAKLLVILSLYTGESPDFWLGAASSEWFAIIPPRATSLDCPPSGPLDQRCANAGYAIGHELGHCLGMKHSCDEYPNNNQCSKSVMQIGWPGHSLSQAILLPEEIDYLEQSQFFHIGGRAEVVSQIVETGRACIIGPEGPRFIERQEEKTLENWPLSK